MTDKQTLNAAHQHRIRQRHLIKMPHLVARGLWELIRARIDFSEMDAGSFVGLNDFAQKQARNASYKATDDKLAPRVAFIVPLIARYLPWRSDCLIQAMAAQRWLAAYGISSEIKIGVDKPENGDFAAHAWLVHRDQVITGGNVDRYSVLIGESPVKLDVDAPNEPRQGKA